MIPHTAKILSFVFFFVGFASFCAGFFRLYYGPRWWHK